MLQVYLEKEKGREREEQIKMMSQIDTRLRTIEQTYSNQHIENMMIFIGET